MVMKILIDGCIFVQPNQAEAILFWKQVIPLLIAQLQEDRIYFLNRTSIPAFPDLAQLNNLFAPKVDFEQFAIETCRLSALCKELEVDLFISTYNTSAGSQVKTLFVLGNQPLLTDAQGEDKILSSKARAIKMASGYLILSQEDTKIPEYLGILKQKPTWLGLPESIASLHTLSESTWQTLASKFAIALRELFNYNPTAEVITQLKAEDELIKSEVLHIRLLAEESAKANAVYPNYKPVKYPILARYLMYLSWAYQALKKPGKYPKYLGIIYQWLRKKLP